MKVTKIKNIINTTMNLKFNITITVKEASFKIIIYTGTRSLSILYLPKAKENTYLSSHRVLLRYIHG